MNKIKFKTTIKCSGCLEKVTPHLNKTEGVEDWEVDLKNPNKVLTVESNGATEGQVISMLQNLGYEAEPIN